MGADALLDEARVAVVGEVVLRRRALLVMRVQRSLATALGAYVEVRDDLTRTPWPLRGAVRDEVGLVLHSARGNWGANQCTQVAPERLRAIRRLPLPSAVLMPANPRVAAPSSGPVRLGVRCGAGRASVG